jgi:hypothetical protein
VTAPRRFLAPAAVVRHRHNHPTYAGIGFRGAEHIPTATSQTAAFGGRRNGQHTGISRTLLCELGPPRRSQADSGQYFPGEGDRTD